ncbi:carbohydrate-binding module family 50 protein [Saccharata proteae CBS 121410]|uniref:Carbohydrate-binding module family 50 protein n=1 Tax=Saccharata proteae CBS 121410 TaxID=1314787 RepID=A0A9P4HUV1_9PEZI|nr:carbohydrate-binding module family 50 protein [Saccharata proteae CBS 121410]
MSLAALATTTATVLAHPSPFPAYTLEKRAPQTSADNCTEYCSVSAGCVCTVRPSDCTAFYTVQPDDTCGTIGDLFANFTISQFYKWNPSIGPTCLGLQAYVPVCINTPWYTFVPPVQADYGTVEDADDTPIPQMPNIIQSCTEYEYVGADQTVSSMAEQNDFPVEDFALWNGNATGPWANYWVCVKA